MRVPISLKIILILCLVGMLLAAPTNRRRNNRKSRKNKQRNRPVTEPPAPPPTAPPQQPIMTMSPENPIHDMSEDRKNGFMASVVERAPDMNMPIPTVRVDSDDDGSPDSPSDRIQPASKMTYHQKMMKARNYFNQYGYMHLMGNDIGDDSHRVEKEKNMIKVMQQYMGLKPTGRLTAKTMEMMDRPRCGVGDVARATLTTTSVLQEYVHQNLRWDDYELKFRILNYPPEMTQCEVRDSLYRAFQVWSDVTPLRFYEVQSGYAEIYILFAQYSHGDGYPFDGVSGTLAHAFLPKSGFGDLEGDVHFDASEHFTFEGGEYNTFNLFQVAAHEIGHALGLSHSQDSTALMAPFYPGYISNFVLPSDDISGITSLYESGNDGLVAAYPGEPQPPHCQSPATTEAPVTTTTTESSNNNLPGPDECNQIFDATGYYRGETFIFKGDKYWRLRNYELISNPDGDISRHFFRNFPGDIDAAYESLQQNRYYVFKGDSYYVYRDLTLESGPSPIRDLDPSLPTHIDSAFSWQKYGKTYFFKDDLVWRFDENTRRVDEFYPVPIGDVWTGVPNGITAAFHEEISSYTYFLKGSNYYRYDDFTFRVDDGYPRPFGWDMLGCGQ